MLCVHCTNLIIMMTEASFPFKEVCCLSVSWPCRIKIKVVLRINPWSPCLVLSLFLCLLLLLREQPRCCWTRSSTLASWRTMCAHQGAPPSTPCTSWRAGVSEASWSMQSRLRAFEHGEKSSSSPKTGFWTFPHKFTQKCQLFYFPTIPPDMFLSIFCWVYEKSNDKAVVF